MDVTSIVGIGKKSWNKISRAVYEISVFVHQQKVATWAIDREWSLANNNNVFVAIVVDITNDHIFLLVIIRIELKSRTFIYEIDPPVAAVAAGGDGSDGNGFEGVAGSVTSDTAKSDGLSGGQFKAFAKRVNVVVRT